MASETSDFAAVFERYRNYLAEALAALPPEALNWRPPVKVEGDAPLSNTPAAIAELSALASAANTAKKPADQAKAKADLEAAGRLLGVLAADPEHWFRASFGEEAAREIDALVAERVAARAAKDFAAADRIRDQLSARGVEVMDNPSGSTWRRKG